MFEASDWTIVDPDWLWIVILSFVIAFILAFGIGANDVANSFGSSVGAKVLTLKQACILGTIFEILGAVLVGAKVSDTIRKGIITIDLFPNGTETEFMMGNMAALTGSCIWMIVASLLKLPVSATHSIVGATLGFSVVARGMNGVNWKQLAFIVGSWFASPVLSGAISTGLFFFLSMMVLNKEKPLEPGLLLLPLFYAFTIAINSFSIFYKGSQLLHFHKIPLYGTFILTFGSAILTAVIVKFIVVPWQRKKIQNHVQVLVKQKEEEGLLQSDKNYQDTITSQSKEAKLLSSTCKQFADANGIPNMKTTDLVVANGDGLVGHSKTSLSNGEGSIKSSALLIKPEKVSKEVSGPVVKVLDGATGQSNGSIVSLETDDSLNEEERLKLARSRISETPETQSLFSFLQVLTAVFGSFAHGGNDVSNAIGPLVAIWITATTGSAAQKAPVPIWILLLGGVGIAAGLWALGRRVMKTLGEDLTKITPSSGFCIEVGSALTVLISSNLGIPVSTTHCKVGSIVFVGWFRARTGVDWKLFRNIIFAWLMTLPIAAGLSAAFMAGLRELL